MSFQLKRTFIEIVKVTTTATKVPISQHPKEKRNESTETNKSTEQTVTLLVNPSRLPDPKGMEECTKIKTNII